MAGKKNESWLSIVGIGEDGLEGLTAEALAHIEAAEVLVGGERHLAKLDDDGRERLSWGSPLEKTVQTLLARRDRRVCILASGDPLCYGIANRIVREIGSDGVVVVPHHSAFTLASARLGWDRARVETLTLHGRPLERLVPHIQPGARLLILSAGGATPGEVAGLLRGRGYGESRLVVFEHMGGPKERRREGLARTWRARRVAELNTIAVECRAGPGAMIEPRTPGLPDSAYEHDGLLTKREVRAATLAALMPIPGQLLWDVGAGSGAIAIEWMRTNPNNRAIAIESHADRLASIERNSRNLGVPDLQIVAGKAPEALAGLAKPDAVFIGGGATHKGLFQACWRALPVGGRLVANVVSLEGEQALMAWRQRRGGDLVRLSIERAEPMGRMAAWRPFRPITQYSAVKS
ncbi:MAG: precorrin-6y C5,15-methyltransferase (decarboxylating) subunit CbiE [Alphaproteobacteria bacterium]|jgi:precorrin-6Y C5,15-methyltransferase (decarboxylating)|nr:precorrin-6y C5,15-methyltransferase (decarboxylating) subunit CbiE [Alphaproteobacteria bacterium]HJP23231.1 precorrin-6y C5,15-methyltransferase (decarboxylating) subunit CbiE [Alphaproteobacteria bacterium]